MFKNKLEELEYEMKKIFSDERVCFYRYHVYEENGVNVLTFVDSEEAKEKLLQSLDVFSKDVNTQIKIMGEGLPEELKYAQVKIPVMDVRKDPRFRSERVRQLIFGEWVKVLEIGKDFSLIKDIIHGYIGYARNQGLAFCNRERMNEICSKPLYKIGSRFALVENIDNVYDSMWVALGSNIYTEDINNTTFEMVSGVYELTKGILTYKKRSQEDFEENIRYFMGTPYLWGGSTVFGTDCSGLVGRLYNLAGKIIPRDADQQEIKLKKINAQEKRFGDLIYFPGHVGMYIGGDLMLHSNIHHGGVSVDNVFSPVDAYGSELLEKITSICRVEDGVLF